MGTSEGNAAKKVKDHSEGPWYSWEETNRAERAIRFMETFCILPKGHGYGEPIKLSNEQKDWFRDILADGVDAAIKSCMRGEGKSTEMAALALWATFDISDSGKPQVPIIATTVSQAMRSIYSVCVDMVKAEPELFDRCNIYTAIGAGRIEVYATGGTCFPMANDPAGLQGLDPSLAIVDEIGFQPVDTWNSVLLASGKRPRSLVVGTGTPGFNRNNALWTIRELVKERGGVAPEGVVYREISAPEGCDYQDEQVWFDASPALRAGYKKIKAVRTIMGLVPESHFRIFQLGQWVEGTDAWLGPNGGQTWDALNSSYTFESGEPVWAGLDVGVKRDSTALVMIQRNVHTGILHASAQIWLPNKDNSVDVTNVMQAIRELDLLYDLRGVAYDPRLFEVPSSMLKDEGINLVEYPQSIERMSPATGALYEAIMNGQITQPGDKMFTQQILNAVPRYNERGFTLTKQKSNGKIDAAVALVMAHDLAIHPVKPRPPLTCL